MHNILEEIIEKKKQDIKKQKNDREPFKVQHAKLHNTFSKAILHPKKRDIAVIGEIKFASPIAGVLGTEKDLLSRANAYAEHGVDAISIVTEKHFFQGDVSFVTKIKKEVRIPVLQKDFVIDPYQIHQAKQAGVDALLLIAKIVSQEQLQEFVDLCLEIGIEPVVEINDERDLQFALQTNTNMIAVNARNLDTFVVDVTNACKMLETIPDTYIRLGFSGITSEKEVQLYKNAVANGILVGTSLMQANNIATFLGGLR